MRSLTLKILIAMIIVSVALTTATVAGAQGLQFGGFVYYSFFCTCSGNWLIFVSPPRFGFFSYNYTPQFANFMLPRSGVWTLGNYVKGGVCKIYVGLGCSTFIPPTGVITPVVGTSL